MTGPLNIAYIQPDILWHDVDGNLLQYNRLISKITDADIIILPEMFATGFTSQVEGLSQPMNGTVVNWMKTKAAEKRSAIIGSQMITESNRCFNRLIMATPDGKIDWYDKRHLFRMGYENETLTPGSDIKIFDYKGWHIRPAICYDLRFPVWLRNVDNCYDLLICIADWPAARHNIFSTLLRARAVENQCYVIGVNRVGTDGLNIDYSGGSCIANAYGDIISHIPDNVQGYEQISLSYSKLNAFRNTFPTSLDADKFKIEQ